MNLLLKVFGNQIIDLIVIENGDFWNGDFILVRVKIMTLVFFHFH